MKKQDQTSMMNSLVEWNKNKTTARLERKLDHLVETTGYGSEMNILEMSAIQAILSNRFQYKFKTVKTLPALPGRTLNLSVYK
jgi:hypothetical protein